MLRLLSAAAPGYNPNNRLGQGQKAWCDAALPRDVAVERRPFAFESTSHEVEVLQQLPVVAAVREFATPTECAEIVRVAEHWLVDQNSRRNLICGKKDCGCWFDLMMDSEAAGASPLQALNNRTVALLRSLSSAGVDYSRSEAPVHLRVQLYNAVAGDAGAWCAPHCDSSCSGEPVSAEQNMNAVAMVSCKVAEVGGETSLSHGSVVYKPRTPGDLILFGLKQSTDVMDVDGRTEHAGCPVERGEKWIVTIRLHEGRSANHMSAHFLESYHDFYDAPVPGQPPVLMKGDQAKRRRQAAGAVLRDKSGNCAAWAASGECATNPVFMTNECALSCKGQERPRQAATLHDEV